MDSSPKLVDFLTEDEGSNAPYAQTHNAFLNLQEEDLLVVTPPRESAHGSIKTPQSPLDDFRLSQKDKAAAQLPFVYETSG